MSGTDAAHSARAQLAALDPSRIAMPSGFVPLPDPVTARHAAVLVLFGVLDAVPSDARDTAAPRDLDVLLQRRAAGLRAHPGQISFPGGRREAEDADAVATALREAREETGLRPDDVDVLARLPELPLAASNHLVTPILGWWQRPTIVAAVDHAETVEVFRTPVADLLSPENRFTSVRRYGTRSFSAPAFEVRGGVVWGFTAMVLSSLFDALGWTEDWDASVRREV